MSVSSFLSDSIVVGRCEIIDRSLFSIVVSIDEITGLNLHCFLISITLISWLLKSLRMNSENGFSPIQLRKSTLPPKEEKVTAAFAAGPPTKISGGSVLIFSFGLGILSIKY